MKKPIFYASLIMLFVSISLCKAQTADLLTVILNSNDQIDRITVAISQLKIELTSNGQLSNSFNHRANNQLELDYYDRFDPQEKRGKLKSINQLTIDYYDRFDNEVKRGKVKQIGDIKIDYYDQFDNSKLKGKIKSIGAATIAYYNQFDGTEKAGKLKSIGEMQIEYYDRFDGPNKSGKIKSIRGNENGPIRLRLGNHLVTP